MKPTITHKNSGRIVFLSLVLGVVATATAFQTLIAPMFERATITQTADIDGDLAKMGISSKSQIPIKPQTAGTRVVSLKKALAAYVVPEKANRSIERQILESNTAENTADTVSKRAVNEPVAPSNRKKAKTLRVAKRRAVTVQRPNSEAPAMNSPQDLAPAVGINRGTGVMARDVSDLVTRAASGKNKLPERPTKTQIASQMSKLSPLVQSCYEKGLSPEPVTLSLRIAGKSGRVIESSVSSETRTAKCIEEHAAKLQFPQFAMGEVTVKYPYSFR